MAFKTENMEDDKLKNLFEDFAPEMTPDKDFVCRIERCVKAVELIEKEAKSKSRRNRRAVVISAFVGFVTGALSMCLAPYLCQMLEEFLKGCAREVSGIGVPTLSYLFFTVATVLAVTATYSALTSRK